MAYWSQSKTAIPVTDSAGADLSLATRSIDSMRVLLTEELRSGPAQEYIHRYLDSVGDGSGTKNGGLDHSGAAEEYMLVPSGEIYRITKLRIFIEDTGGAFPYDGYGAIATGTVTNGVEVKVKDGSGDVLDLLHGIPATSNSTWLHHGQLETISPFSTGYLMVVTLDFAASGTVVRLDPTDNSQYLAVILEDNFSTIETHCFIAEGYVE